MEAPFLIWYETSNILGTRRGARDLLFFPKLRMKERENTKGRNGHWGSLKQTSFVTSLQTKKGAASAQAFGAIVKKKAFYSFLPLRAVRGLRVWE